MKKLSITLIVVISMGFSVQSCTDEDKIAAALQGTREQSEGEQAPIFLYQNFPNPFNPSTVIHFDLSQLMHLTLKVYTEDWQEVKTLVDGVHNAGRYSVTFSATELPSGEYYYVLEGRGHTQIRKMKLVK